MREVLGKKLSKGTKKDLDDISTKTGITLKSCRRQVGTAASSSPTQHSIDSPPLWPLSQLQPPPPLLIVAAASDPVSSPVFVISKQSLLFSQSDLSESQI